MKNIKKNSYEKKSLFIAWACFRDNIESLLAIKTTRPLQNQDLVIVSNSEIEDWLK